MWGDADAYEDMLCATADGHSWVSWAVPEGVHAWRFRLAGASIEGAYHADPEVRVAFHLALIDRGRRALID